MILNESCSVLVGLQAGEIESLDDAVRLSYSCGNFVALVFRSN